MGSAFDQTVEPEQQQASQVADSTSPKRVSAFSQTVEPPKPKEQFDLGATYNQYVKPTLDAAGAEFKQHGLIPELFDAGRGAAQGVAELGDLYATPGRVAANAVGDIWHIPHDEQTYAKTLQSLLGKPQGQIAHALGHFLPSLAVQANPRGVIKNALAQGGLNTALGEGTRFAQTGQFNPEEAVKQFGIGTVVGGTLGLAGKGLEHYQLSKNGINKDFKASMAGRRATRDEQALHDAQFAARQSLDYTNKAHAAQYFIDKENRLNQLEKQVTPQFPNELLKGNPDAAAERAKMAQSTNLAMQQAQQKLAQAAADREAALAKRQANYKEPKPEAPKPILDHFEQAERDVKDFGDRSRMIGASNAVRKGRKGGQGHNYANDGFVPAQLNDEELQDSIDHILGLQRLNGGTKGAADLKALVAEKMYRATVKNRNNFDAKSDDELVALMAHENEEVQRKALETLEKRHPDPPNNGGSGGGNHPEQFPPHLSTREQVNAMKHANARPATAEEAAALRDVVLAKTRRDKAYHQFESAFMQFTEKLKARGVVGPAYTQRPNFIHPNVDKQLRDAAAKAADLSHLVETPNAEASLIRDENNSVKFGEYALKGKDDVQAGIEIKKLADRVNALQKQYEAVRDAARITTRLKDTESIHMDVNGHRYTVSNQTRMRYKPPAEASATQANAYKSALKASRQAEQAKSPIVDMEPRITKLADVISSFNPELSKILTGHELDDKALQALGEKTGRLAEIRQFFNEIPTDFIESEAGHGVTEYGFTLATLPLRIIWKAAGMTGVKTPKQFINRAGQVFMNEMNMDIFKREADPRFVAELQQAIAKRALAFQGIDMEHMTQAAIKDLHELRTEAEIMASKNLTPQIKAAILKAHEIKKEGAAMIKRYQDSLDPKNPTNKNVDKHLHSIVHKELILNWQKPTYVFDAGADFLNAITSGTVRAISLGNTKMHGLHGEEALMANLVYEPGGFARALHALATDKKNTWAFANSWNMKMPISQMAEDSTNRISDWMSKAQEPLVQAIKANKYTHAAQQAISGQGIEHAKSNLTLITASEYAAKEMKYPGGGTALRRDMVQAISNPGAMTPAKRLEAAVKIWDFMNRALGTGPVDYRVANVVDRASAGGGFGAAIVRLLAPFSRSIIQQSRVQTGILKDLGKAIVTRDFPGIVTGTRQLLTTATVTTAFAGASALPWEVRNALANGDDNSRKTLAKIEDALDHAAIAGHYLGGFRMMHIQPSFFPGLKIGGNMAAAAIQNVQTLDSSKSKDKSKIAAASMFAAKIGMNEIAETMSLETARKIYNAYTEAAEHGTHTTQIYSEPGMHLKTLGGQKLPLPFGLGELSERTKSQRLKPVVEKTTPTAAVLRAIFMPGDSEEEEAAVRKQRNEYDAKMARKSRR